MKDRGAREQKDSVGEMTMRPSFLPFDEILANRADPGLLDELREMLPDTTNDFEDPWKKSARAAGP